jgi:hypothetical protein
MTKKAVAVVGDVHFDFDQFMQEQSKTPVIIKVYGQTEELPSELPALVLLRISDLQKRGAEKTDIHDIFDMAYAIFTEKRVKAWLHKGMSIKGLEVILQRVMKIYTGDADGDDKSPRVE